MIIYRPCSLAEMCIAEKCRVMMLRVSRNGILWTIIPMQSVKIDWIAELRPQSLRPPPFEQSYFQTRLTISNWGIIKVQGAPSSPSGARTRVAQQARPVSASARSVRVFSELNPERRDIEAVVTGHHRLLRGLTPDTHTDMSHGALAHRRLEPRAGEPSLGMWAGRQFKTHVIIMSDHCNANVCTVSCFITILCSSTFKLGL